MSTDVQVFCEIDELMEPMNRNETTGKAKPYGREAIYCPLTGRGVVVSISHGLTACLGDDDELFDTQHIFSSWTMIRFG